MAKNRLLLLDRDGVINIDHGYVGTIDRFAFMPEVFPFLRTARDNGYRLAIFTNQSGVARGKFTEVDHSNLTAHMLTALRREGIEIDVALASFEHPDGMVAPFVRESFWRKPNPGMALEILRQLNGDASHSLCIGDNMRDIKAAQAAGINRCLLLGDGTTDDDVQTVKDLNAARALLTS